MSIQFAISLVRDEILSPSQFVEFMAARTRHQVPLGTLAIRENLMTVREVIDVLDAQDRRHGRFGEIAVELGFLTSEQVNDLLALQQEKLPRVAEQLVALGMLSKGQVRALQTEFLSRTASSVTATLPKPKFSQHRANSNQTVESSR